MMKSHVHVLVACLLLQIGCQQSPPETSADEVVGIGTKDSLYSEILGEMRPLWVHLPGNPAEPTNDQKYPVLYLLDGNDHFHAVSGLVDQLSAVRGNTVLPEMIVVGIPNTNRSRDLTPTEVAIDFWLEDSIQYENGGGQDFLSFLETELIPYIDAKYPTADNRTFVGHSFGGIAVLNALIRKPEVFDQYIAIDPSLWWDHRILIEQAQRQFTDESLTGKGLFVSIAKTPPGEFTLDLIEEDTAKSSYHLRSILTFCRWLEQQDHLGLDFAWDYYENDDHGSVPLISEYDGLRSLFGWYRFKDYSELYQLPDDTPVEQIASTVTSHFKRVSTRLGYEIPPKQGLVNDLGYYFLEKGLMEKSRVFFQMNLDNYPEEADTFDSMGDYYLAQNDTANAIVYFQKGADGGLDYSQAKLDKLKSDN